MDIKFENQYYSTNEMLSEYVNKVLCRKMRVLGTIVSVVALVMLFITFFDNDYILSTVFGISLFLSAFVTIIAPLLMIRNLKESDKHIHNGKKFKTIVLFGDNITISEGSFSLTVEYAQILKTHSLEHSYVLMFGKCNGIILSLDHFTVGTFEDFKLFIEVMSNLARSA
ncbi:MAG: hypothetical protein WAX04_09255 [Oscillospiraceae bacterium]